MSDNVMPFPPPAEQDPGEALAEKIIELCDAEDSNVNVLAAVMSALTYSFGRFCPDCQRRLVKGIKKELPNMVRMANEAKEHDKGNCH